MQTVRLTLRIGSSSATGSRRSSAGRAALDDARCRAPSRGRGPASATQRMATVGGTSGLCRIGDRSTPFAFQCVGDVAHVEHVDAADHLVDRAEAELGHDLAQLLGDEDHEVDDVLGLALELLAQPRVLRGDADRAGVQVADAHHDAARRDERRRGEAELLGAEQRRDGDVAAGLQLAVGLDADAAAQVVGDQDLLRLGEAELPRDAGVLDRGERRGAGAALVAADEHDVGLRLGHAGGDRADADLGDQLHADARPVVRVLQVVDELRQVLDRVDVVVRRRRDEADARRRVADAWRCTRRPCGRGAGRPRRASRPAPS